MARDMKPTGLSWVQEVPIDWDIIQQKYLMRKTKTICEHYAGEPVLSLTTNGVIIRDVESGKGKFPATFDGYQYIHPGNLVLCLFDIDVTPCCVGLAHHYGVISPAYSQFEMQDGADARYYDYYLHAIDNQKLYLHLTSTLRSSMTADVFGAIRAPRPSLQKQRAIADYLDAKCAEIDRAINAAEQSITDMKQLRQAYLDDAIDECWCNNHPMKLKYVLRELKEKSLDGVGEPLSITISRGVLLSSEINVPFSASSKVGAKMVKAGDLVFNKLKAYFGVMYVSPYDGLVSPDYAVYRALPGVALPKYVEYVVHTSRVIDEFIIRISGVADGFRRLYTDDLFDVAISVPPIDEQKAIIGRLSSLYEDIERATAAKRSIIDDLKAYKQSLIYEVVTGKREV